MNPLPVLAILGFLSVSAFFTGCQTAPQPQLNPLRTSATFAASKEAVWPSLVSEVGLEYPVRVIEKASGLITTDWITLPAGFNNRDAEQWIFPIGGFLATWNGLRMNMKIMVVENEPHKTLVTINCHYEAFENNVQKTWLVGASNGAIENTILSKVEKRLASGGTSPESEKPSASVAKSPSDSLLELKKLLDAGAITPAEFEAKKKALLEKL